MKKMVSFPILFIIPRLHIPFVLPKFLIVMFANLSYVNILPHLLNISPQYACFLFTPCISYIVIHSQSLFHVISLNALVVYDRTLSSSLVASFTSLNTFNKDINKMINMLMKPKKKKMMQWWDLDFLSTHKQNNMQWMSRT